MKTKLIAFLLCLGITAAVADTMFGGGGSGSGGGSWGSITGTLADQTDLGTALDGKVNDTGAETVAGVKTLSSMPILSAGTASKAIWLNSSKAIVSATTFSPANLGIDGWYEARYIPSSPADNSAVTTWPSYNVGRIRRDLTQATAGQKPTYQTNELDTHPVVRCSSATTADSLYYISAAPFASMALPSPYAGTIIVVFKGSDTTAHLFAAGSASAGFLATYGNGMFLDSSGQLAFKATNNGVGPVLTSSQTDFSSWTVGTARWGRDGADLYIGTSSVDTDTTFTGEYLSYDRYSICSGVGSGTTEGADFYDGDIAAVFFFDRKLSDFELAMMWAYIDSVYPSAI